MGTGHHCRRDTIQIDGPEGQPRVRNGLDTAVWPSCEDACAFDKAGEGDMELMCEEPTRGQARHGNRRSIHVGQRGQLLARGLRRWVREAIMVGMPLCWQQHCASKPEPCE